jgi:purine-binding chemotaxis protein CheW
VGGREHAVPVEDVIEVVRMVAVTPLPEAPPWIAGVINMRGHVIPVIDLRIRLGMSPRDPELSTPIIVVGRSEPAAGLIADGASEVLTFGSGALEAPHPRSTSAAAVSALAHQGDRLILLLDAERLCEDAAHLPLPLAG